MKQKIPLSIVVALSLSSLALMADSAIYPVVNLLYEEFTDTNLVLLNFIISGPSLMVIIGSIICGILAQYVGKKQLLIGAYVFFALTAIPTWIDHIVLIAVLRGISGFMIGIISVASVGLVAELFADEVSRSKMMGTYNAVMTFLGSTISLFTGILATYHWNWVFATYLMAVPVIFLVAIFVPKTKPEGMTIAEDSPTSESMPWGIVLSIATSALMINSMYGVILTMISVYLDELQMGDAATAGMMGVVITLGGMGACLLFSRIYLRLRRFTPLLFMGIMGLGFFLMLFPINVPFIAFINLVMGISGGLNYAYYLMYASISVPPSKASLSIAIANSAVYGGLFISPYVCPLLYKLLGVSTVIAVTPYLAIISLVCAIISTILALQHKKTKHSF